MPRLSRIYPACPIHQYLGLLCPGCGATRALSALLHGQPALAWQLNALVLLLLPLALLYTGLLLRNLWHGRPNLFPGISAAATCFLLAASAFFTLARNLPL